MMRKFYITGLIILLLLVKWDAAAQRYFVTNLYTYDLYLVNPAAAALKKDCYTVNGYVQKQWLGTDESPGTQILSFQKAFQSNLGIGSYIYNDQNGYHHEIGAQQSAAYRVKLLHSRRKVANLLFGMSLMANQRSLDIASIGDAAANNPNLQKSSGYGFNANAGLMFTLNKWQVGFSATNIFPYTNSLYSSENEPRTYTDLNFHASYFFKIPNRELYIEPLLFYRRNNYLDSRSDFNLKLTMPTADSDLTLWGMVAYRQNSDHNWGNSLGMATTMGVIWKGFKIGLEYQLGLTNARRDFGNAYQLVAGYRFCRDRTKDALACPEDFKRNKKRVRK